VDPSELTGSSDDARNIFKQMQEGKTAGAYGAVSRDIAGPEDVL